MKIHYFQRYHSKENVDTANAILLLSRLYTFSSTKFFAFLATLLPENASVELLFNLQEKSQASVPDATITQASFKVVVETKLNGNFWTGQLKNHLSSFKGESYKVLLTLDPRPMMETTENKVKQVITDYNTKNDSNVIHRHLTFENLATLVSNVLDDRDHDMKDVLEDFKEYCYTSGLIPDDWKRMRVQLAGVTLDINKKLNLYYDDVGRGFSGHKYLGLYKEKAVRAVGEIIAVVTAVPNGNIHTVDIEKGTINDEMKERIKLAIDDSKQYGYDLTKPHRYFFVDKFYDTFFEKSTPRAPMGSRMFDLCEVLGVAALPDTKEIADLLRQKDWS